MPAEDVTDERTWQLVGEYLALGIANVICVLSPERVVIGGGVMGQAALLPRIRERVKLLLAGYFSARELDGDLSDYIVPPSLGGEAGVLGSLELARMALAAGPAA